MCEIQATKGDGQVGTYAADAEELDAAEAEPEVDDAPVGNADGVLVSVTPYTTAKSVLWPLVRMGKNTHDTPADGLRVLLGVGEVRRVASSRDTCRG